MTDPRNKDKIPKTTGAVERKFLDPCRSKHSSLDVLAAHLQEEKKPPFPFPPEEKCTADHRVDFCSSTTIVTVKILTGGFKPDENRTSKSHNLIIRNKNAQ